MNTPLRLRLWAELSQQPGCIHGLSSEQLDGLRDILLTEDDFWCDLLFRHKLVRQSLADLDSTKREQAINTFWATVHRAADSQGLLK